MRQLSPVVQPCSIAMWPTVTSAPMVSGWPGSACRTVPSCTLDRSPTVMGSGLSPRMVTPNHTLDCSFSTTFPTTAAFGATQADSATLGRTLPRLYVPAGAVVAGGAIAHGKGLAG